MCLLAAKVPIDRKCAYWKIKRHNCLVFLNVYMAVIHVPMWCNKEQLTKVKMCLLAENVSIE